MSHSVYDSEFLRRQNNKLKEKVILQERVISSLKGKSLTSDEATDCLALGDAWPSNHDVVVISIGTEASLVNIIDSFIDSIAKKAELHKQDKVFLTSFLTSYIEEAGQ